MGGAISTGAAVQGVEIHPLRQITDERGSVMHMIRADSPHFQGIGEVYFSVVKAGVVKAWKKHRVMTQNIAVPIGEIRLTIYDDRPDSKTRGALQEIVTGVNHYALVRIPPLVWYGFKGLGKTESMLVNCASIPHDPAEAEQADRDSAAIPYNW